MHVIGTAGHVDHGKSTLVKALTGIDPDRLKEEKERQMTIDLGFAWLTLPTGEEVGIVDVPGHIDFIHNMLAGAGGIDAALLVVAADEGVMPQTREHLAILHLLGVTRGLVAITKIDLVDEEWLALVEEDVREALRPTVLADAPVIPVSALTGEGLDRLLQALADVLRHTPPRPDRGRPRLPVDRVFTVAGFGTVVTGTLIDGTLHVGQEVEILPEGRRGRIRGLQTHKRARETALPGSRVAVNLSGVNRADVRRGDVVTLPGLFRPTTLVDVRLQALADISRPLRHNDELFFFVGAAETPARLRLLGTDVLEPGASGWAQLVLQRPVVTARGDRFILRRPSPSETVGGGVVLDPAPGRKHKRFRAEVLRGLEVLAQGDPTEILYHRLSQMGPRPLNEVVHRCGLSEDEARQALETLLAAGRVVLPAGRDANIRVDDRWIFTREQWEAALARLREAVQAYHRAHPLRQAVPREHLVTAMGRGRPWPPEVVQALLDAAQAAGWLVAEPTGYRLHDHRPRFSEADQAAVERLLAAFRERPYTPPTYEEALALAGEAVVDALLERGDLVRVSDEILFLRETYDHMRDTIVAFLREHESLTVAQARDLFGSSRKYVVPFLEHLDAQHITRRVGDRRVLRGRGDDKKGSGKRP